MNTIHTLVTDIYHQVKQKGGWFTPEIASEMASEISLRLQLHFGREQSNRLRLSQMGPKCFRSLWYSLNHPELAEDLPPWALIKYSYGHVLEAMAISLSKASGHIVTGEQDELELDGILGHRDCVIDGCLVDVKSTSTRGFDAFKNQTLHQSDAFGYLDQLDAYLVASSNDSLVKVKDKAYILAIDKQLGHMALYQHELREDRIRQRVKDHKEVAGRASPPECTCGTEPKGQSGNIGLDTKASYSAFKHCCFPGLRTFIYANGPVYLTKVVRKPDVKEVDKYGREVY